MDEKKGWWFLSFWAALIFAGIVAKRFYGHPDLVVFFHLPAAVCLVVGWFGLSRKYRERYKQSLRGHYVPGSAPTVPRPGRKPRPTA